MNIVNYCLIFQAILVASTDFQQRGLGFGGCTTHSQCGDNRYCFSCADCYRTPGCTVSDLCRNRPSGGDCAPLANCYRDRDAIDGRCPSTSGGSYNPCAAVTCPWGQRCERDGWSYKCQPNYGGGWGGYNPCNPNPCSYNQRCVPQQIQCFRYPCPQYRCEDRGFGSGSCGQNEEYTSCGSSSCWEQSCSNPTQQWPPRICTTDCRRGCRCQSGYKRNFDGVCRKTCYVIGRPFSTETGYLIAPVMTPSLNIEGSEIFSDVNGSSFLDSIIPEGQRAQAAEYWASIAMMEHASVASFSRFSLQLMSVGAPPELLGLVHQAALDEVRHTEVSLALANEFGAVTVRPGPLPLANKDSESFAFGNMEKIATAAALEGCIEETLAAAVAQYQADHMGDPNHQAQLRSVAADEARHAALAWRAVQWMTTTSPEIHKAVSLVFNERAKRYASAPETAAEPILQHLGLLDQGTMEKLQYTAWHEIVVPAAASLGFLPKNQVRSSNPILNLITMSIASCNPIVA